MKIAGKVIVTLFLAGFALCGQALAEEVADVNSAINQIQIAIVEKLAAMESIDAALAEEQAVCDTLEQMLADKDYGGLTKNDVAKAQRETEAVMRKQGRAKGLLEKCVAEMQGTLSTLGWQPPAPVGHWALDDGSGNTAEDSAGTNDGTLYGDPNWVAGQLDGALDFDGSNDYVAIPDNPELRFSGPQPFSISLWFKRSANMPGNEVLLTKGYSGDPENTNYGIYIANSNKTIRFTWEHGSGSNDDISSGVSATVGQWYHAVGVWDGSTQAIYINGTLSNSVTPAGSPHAGDNRPVVIGRLPTGSSTGGADFKGTIDDVRIYDTGLTAYETYLLYNNSLD